MKSSSAFFSADQLQSLIDSIHAEGYSCIGPQLRDSAIVYDELISVDQLPRGVLDEQQPGSYRLNSSTSTHYFNWANGPQAIKPFMFAPKEQLWQCERDANGSLHFSQTETVAKPVAIFAARACDVAALKIHDQHFLEQQFVDPYYQQRRQSALVVAVNCSSPSACCFCASTGDGPFVNNDSADIVLTELDDGFLCDVYSDKGNKIVSQLEITAATETHSSHAQQIRSMASKQQRQLPEVNLQGRLSETLRSDAYDDIARQCLSCGNCTAVCPTCFCHSETEVQELDGSSSSHYREWDSCFTQGHSYIHGITIRKETAQRYRQWLTHKFSSWYEQYGRSGCVGCGRCISWCPVGIDVIESLKSVCGEQS